MGSGVKFGLEVLLITQLKARVGLKHCLGKGNKAPIPSVGDKSFAQPWENSAAQLHHFHRHFNRFHDQQISELDGDLTFKDAQGISNLI